MSTSVMRDNGLQHQTTLPADVSMKSEARKPHISPGCSFRSLLLDTLAFPPFLTYTVFP